MTGVVLSGKAYRIKEFHQILLNSSQNHCHKVPGNSIVVPGRDGVFGILLDVPVHFIRLKV